MAPSPYRTAAPPPPAPPEPARRRDRRRLRWVSNVLGAVVGATLLVGLAAGEVRPPDELTPAPGLTTLAPVVPWLPALPAAQAAPTLRPTPRQPTPPSPTTRMPRSSLCDPPYRVDANGRKSFKPGCL